MDELDTFGDVFSSSVSYKSNVIDAIVRHRRILENTLFFDRLLHAVGIQDATDYYPPRNLTTFQSLFTEIHKAPVSDTHKAAVLYYLRKDVELDPEQFAKDTCLPQRYIILINGLWYLDRLNLKEALTYLADPSLIPTFSEEILYTLATHAGGNPALALEYYNSTFPVLKHEKSLKAYFSALASCDVTEAFFFTRHQSENARKYLFEHLVAQVHGPSSSVPSGEKRAKQSVELVGLPFDEVEEKWFEDFLLKGKGKGLVGAKDTIIFRRIVSGRSDDIASLAKDIKERRIDGINWQDLVRSRAIE